MERSVFFSIRFQCKYEQNELLIDWLWQIRFIFYKIGTNTLRLNKDDQRPHVYKNVYVYFVMRVYSSKKLNAQTGISNTRDGGGRERTFIECASIECHFLITCFKISHGKNWLTHTHCCMRIHCSADSLLQTVAVAVAVVVFLSVVNWFLNIRWVSMFAELRSIRWPYGTVI